MKIFSYNVNGIRSTISKGFFDWFENAKPEVLCIQETKAQPEQIEVQKFEKLGYNIYLNSAQKKGYSGTAIFSKIKPDNVIIGIGNKKFDSEGRYIRLDFGDVSLINSYFPSGSNQERQAVKMEYLDYFTKHITELLKERQKIIIVGDFNICRLWIDIHSPETHLQDSGFLPEEREWFQKLMDMNFIDTFRIFNQDPEQYSWWSYRATARIRNKGWRIDYILATDNLKENLQKASIHKDVAFSDHCPVSAEFIF